MGGRWVLAIKNGFVIVEDDNWGRIIYNDGHAEDIKEESHPEIFRKVRTEGEWAPV